MALASQDHSMAARSALREIVAEYGPEALSRPAMLSNLLTDLLPDVPAVARIITAAAAGKVGSALRENVSQGLSPDTACRLVVSSFARATMFKPEACAWVVGEFAVALGLLAETDRIPAIAASSASPPSATPGAQVGTLPGPATGQPAAMARPELARGLTAGPRSRSRKHAGRMTVVVMACLVLAAAVVAEVARSQQETGHMAASSRPPSPTAERGAGAASGGASFSIPGSVQSVTFASPAEAWAIGAGNARPSRGDGALIAHWNGSAWKRSLIPLPEGSFLSSVAASSATSAWAVGQSTVVTTDANGSAIATNAPLILHWDGATWARVPCPSTAIPVGLASVTATSPASAWAVGGTESLLSQAVIMHWDGAAWNLVPNPAPADNSTLESIIAVSPDSAWAVGVHGDDALIEHWNGSTWQLISSPPYARYLTGVAATSDANVWAVGSDKRGETLIMRWNGTAWLRVPSPSPPGASLSGVMAISAVNAWAVGFSATGNGRALILRWNGSSWVEIAAPGNAMVLNGVASDSAGGTWIAGRTNSDTLILRWDGSGWK